MHRSAALLLALPCAAPVSAEPQTERPNVVLIVADDLNDWVGALNGDSPVPTPNVDRLASSGLLFTNAHTPVPSDASRVAALTGLRPESTTLFTRGVPMRQVLPGATTVMQVFAENRYEVVGYGPILPHPDRDSWKLHTFRFSKPVPSYERRASPTSKADGIEWGPYEGVEDDEMYDARAVDWISRFLARGHVDPFFLALGFFKPSPPWRVPQGDFDAVEGVSLRIPETPSASMTEAGRALTTSGKGRTELQEAESAAEARRAYLASLVFLDRQLGRLLDLLEENDLAESTIVVFMSDNGFHLGEKGHWGAGTLWEESTRVPFIVRAPGVTEPGSRSSRPVELTSLFATLVDLCDLRSDDDLDPDGPSLVRLLRDPDAEWPHVARTAIGPDDFALRSERWRYVRYLGGEEELYDHDSDPGETENLAADPEYAEVLAEMRARAGLPE